MAYDEPATRQRVLSLLNVDLLIVPWELKATNTDNKIKTSRNIFKLAIGDAASLPPCKGTGERIRDACTTK